MRRIISLALAAALTAIGGVGPIYPWLFAADWKSWMVTGAGCIHGGRGIGFYNDLQRAQRLRSNADVERVGLTTQLPQRADTENPVRSEPLRAWRCGGCDIQITDESQMASPKALPY
jgi:hypothetical protein